MPDFTMCTNYDCPMQDSCLRLNAPPSRYSQPYQKFVFDEEAFEKDGDYQCDFYIEIRYDNGT